MMGSYKLSIRITTCLLIITATKSQKFNARTDSLMNRISRKFVLTSVFAGLCCALSGCKLAPEKRDAVSQRAATGGFEAAQIIAGRFKLFTLARGLETHAPLTVYIEGDGRAWRRGSQPPKDPTPKYPVALELAMRDQSPAVLYIARPCQWLDAQDLQTCSVNYWANLRYAEEVITAVNDTIDQLIAQRPSASDEAAVGLVGYSGGGTVAALVAARRADVAWLVTVSANLDHEAWTRLGELTPLSQSLNPTDFAAQLSNIPQLHLIGENDKIVPIEVLRSYADALHSDRVAVEPVAEFSHRCCWEEIWPARLERFIGQLR